MVIMARRLLFRAIGIVVGRQNVTATYRSALVSHRNFCDFKDVLKRASGAQDKKAPDEGETAQRPPKEQQNNANPVGGILSSTQNFFGSIFGGIRDAHQELFGEKKTSMLKRKVEQAESFRRTAKNSEGEEGDEDAYEGPSELVVVKSDKSPWEAMRERLQNSPFIREAIHSSRRVVAAAAETDLGKKATQLGQGVRDKIEDAREFWETSQNPLVYRLAGLVENLTAETEEAICVREIKKLDPAFIKEEWAEEVKRQVAPMIIKAHLQGDLRTLKPWLGEAVYNKLAADIRIRKADGLVFDSNILALDENMMIVKMTEHVGPVILVVYMVQQINCITNRAGEIVEGGETEIRAKFYSIAFRQVYDEDASTVRWEIADYELAGDTPYL